jgi:hypothetical protein
MLDHPAFIDELFSDASCRRIIVFGRQCGKSTIAFEMYKRALERATQGGSVDPPRRPWSRESGGVTIPCPWGREDGPVRFCPTDYLPMNDPSRKVADSVARKVNCQDELDALRYVLGAAAKKKEPKKPPVDLKPRREVDRLRTADILQAMTIRNATDQAIPEEWMDELDDLVWRERDRLAAAAGS